MKQTAQNQTEIQEKGNAGSGENEDKEFLRTEPLGKLLLKLALPTVAAQLINMLYNIVGRIYIGHMPENGQAALKGLGVYAVYFARFGVCCAHCQWRRTARIHLHGQGRQRERRMLARQLFRDADHHFRRADGDLTHLQRTAFVAVWRE